MEKSFQQVTGILLAGGMSRRMGSDKGQLRLGGRMLYTYALSTLEKLCSEILISSSTELPGTDAYTSVGDSWKHCGPLGGIHSCLTQSRTELNLVLAYDMPLVNAGLLNYLLDQSSDADLVVPVPEGGKPEPLCAVYSRRLLPLIEEQLQAGDLALHHLFPRTNTLSVAIGPGMPFYQEDLFLNVNNPVDLNEIKRDGKLEE